MFGFFSSIAISYLAVTGTVANGAIVARGLKRALEAAVRGDMRDARTQVLAAFAAPAVVAVAAVGALVGEVVHSASALAEPATARIYDNPVTGAAG